MLSCFYKCAQHFLQDDFYPPPSWNHPTHQLVRSLWMMPWISKFSFLFDMGSLWFPTRCQRKLTGSIVFWSKPFLWPALLQVLECHPNCVFCCLEAWGCEIRVFTYSTQLVMPHHSRFLLTLRRSLPHSQHIATMIPHWCLFDPVTKQKNMRFQKLFSLIFPPAPFLFLNVNLLVFPKIVGKPQKNGWFIIMEKPYFQNGMIWGVGGYHYFSEVNIHILQIKVYRDSLLKMW